MEFPSLLTLGDPQALLPLVKLLFVLGLCFYLFFSYIVIRQVGLMINSLQGLLSRSLLLFAYLHFGLVLVLLMLSIVVL